MEKASNKIKLGIFVLSGTILLIISLYLIGTKQNLFNKTFSVYVKFHNVGGLIAGNNVRFAGIAIGTVKEVEIVNDTIVLVEMVIRQDAMRFIRKASMAEIGSDGLMGNRLINLSTPNPNSPFIAPGDTIVSLTAVETDEMMRTLNKTNENVLVISSDLRKITRKIHDSNPMWDLLADSMAADNIRRTLRNIESASSRAGQMTLDAENLLKEIREGNGMAGKILSDDSTALVFEQTMANLKAATDTAKLALHHMHEFMEDLNLTPGPLGVLARDTAMGADMKNIFKNLNESTVLLNENLTALRSNFLFRKYFRKKAKEEERNN
ncbi:MAG: MCE family protein [Bacteroidetes bacterium]|nr:MCE family protein [Bacteroidota bacterium]